VRCAFHIKRTKRKKVKTVVLFVVPEPVLGAGLKNLRQELRLLLEHSFDEFGRILDQITSPWFLFLYLSVVVYLFAITAL